MHPIDALIEIWVSQGYIFPDDFVLVDFDKARAFCDELVTIDEIRESNYMSKFIEWEDWPLYKEAKEMWDKVVPHLTEEELEDLGPFNTSFNYLAARVAYRRYLNHSPRSETT